MSAFKSIHKYYSSCHDDNGDFSKEKAEKIIKSFVYYGNERLTLLESIYSSVLKASFINKFGRLYLINSNMTVRDVGKNYNENLSIGEEVIKEGTARSQINYCSNKINDIFKDLQFGKETFDIVTWLLDANTFRLDNDSDKQQLRDDFLEQLSIFNDLYVEKPIIGKKDLVITLPRCEKVKEIDKDTFNEFMNLIRPYSWNEVRKVQSKINDYMDCIGYLKYIMTPSMELTSFDRENRANILGWLGKESDTSDSIRDLEEKMDKDFETIEQSTDNEVIENENEIEVNDDIDTVNDIIDGVNDDIDEDSDNIIIVNEDENSIGEDNIGDDSDSDDIIM